VLCCKTSRLLALLTSARLHSTELHLGYLAVDIVTRLMVSLSVSVGYIAASRFLGHKCSGVGQHSGLAGVTHNNESSKTVHRVGMSCSVVQIVPVHCHSHKDNEYCSE